MELQRRTFLGSLGTGALAASAGAQAAAPAAASAVAANPAWDLSWVERVNGRHRAVFDAPEFSGGAGLQRAVVWKRQYKEVYGTPPEAMSAVLVLRAAAIWLVMNDVFWKDYGVGEKQDFRHGDKGFYTANPIASAAPDAKPEAAGMNLPSFLASGNIVLACHLAFRGVVALVKKADGLATDEEAEKKAMRFVVPGVIMQPSGVFATLRAQEAGCGYILAS